MVTWDPPFHRGYRDYHAGLEPQSRFDDYLEGYWSAKAGLVL